METSTNNLKKLPTVERIGLFMDELKTLDNLNAEIKGDDLKKKYHLNAYVYKAMIDLDLLDHPRQSRVYTCKWEMDDNGKTPRIYARHIAEWCSQPALNMHLKRLKDKGDPLGRPALDQEPVPVEVSVKQVKPRTQKRTVHPVDTIEKDVKVNVHVNFKITFG